MSEHAAAKWQVVWGFYYFINAYGSLIFIKPFFIQSDVYFLRPKMITLSVSGTASLGWLQLITCMLIKDVIRKKVWIISLK